MVSTPSTTRASLAFPALKSKAPACRHHSIVVIAGLAAMLSLRVTLALSAATHTQEGPLQPVVQYSLEEGSGDVVHDSSEHHLDARIVHGAVWTGGIRGRAILFNGSNRIVAPPNGALDQDARVTISAWIRGVAQSFTTVDGFRNYRAPDFQVCGDKIYLATSDDNYPDWVKHAKYKDWHYLEWKDAFHVWTGSADISLADWHFTNRTEEPLSGLEPKLQVTEDRIYYEYFGQDVKGTWQVWTADSSLDGSNWRSIQRTTEQTGYRIEQDGNLQAASGRVYIGFPRKDASDKYQLWTATYSQDGSDYRALQRTTDSGWIPQIQVAGNKVYYLFLKTTGTFAGLKSIEYPYEICVASSNRDGSNWRTIRCLGEGNWGGANGWWGNFEVHRDRIYLVYSLQDRTKKHWTHLFTASMGVDGGKFTRTQRTFGPGFARTAGRGGLQVVGDTVYYVYDVVRSPQSPKDVVDHIDEWLAELPDRAVWTAQSRLDGLGWKATKRTSGRPYVAMLGYRGLQVVGAKEYLGLHKFLPGGRLRGALAVMGANIVSKGSAYGIGVTEDGKARAFVNAGQDYLVRDEAPEDVAGATADAAIDDSWHHVTMTYDRQELKLYVDGRLMAKTQYTAPIGHNSFPLLIGDGFLGTVDEITIYDHALDPLEVQTLYEQFKPAAH